jgi:hypothetical protein
MQAHGGEELWFLLILDHDSRWGSGHSHAPAALYPWGKDPLYQSYRRLGGPQITSRHRLEEQFLLPLSGIEPRSPGRPVRSQTLY